MIKLTLILLIVVIVTKLVAIIWRNSMSPLEKLAYAIHDDMPTGLFIVAIMHILSVIGFIICTILTIVMW